MTCNRNMLSDRTDAWCPDCGHHSILHLSPPCPICEINDRLRTLDQLIQQLTENTP